jgi:hypothetical protein
MAVRFHISGKLGHAQNANKENISLYDMPTVAKLTIKIKSDHLCVSEGIYVAFRWGVILWCCQYLGLCSVEGQDDDEWKWTGKDLEGSCRGLIDALSRNFLCFQLSQKEMYQILMPINNLWRYLCTDPQFWGQSINMILNGSNLSL